MLLRAEKKYNWSEELNLYMMVGNDLVNHVDRLGLDRWHVDWLHTWIIVEEWDNCCRKIGYLKIEFGPKYLVGGVIGPGEVTISRVKGPPTSGYRWKTKSTCREDQALIDWARMLQGDPPLYSVFIFNCRYFSAYGQGVGIRKPPPKDPPEDPELPQEWEWLIIQGL